MSRNKWRKIFVLIGTTLASSPLSLLTYYGNLLPYLTSYYHAHRHRMLVYVDPLWLSTLFRSCFTLSMVFTSPLEQRFGLRPCITAGLVFLNISIFSGFFAVREPLALTLLFGATQGTSMGLIHSLALKLLLQTMHVKGGTASGVMFSGISFSSLLNIGVAYAVINPKNEKANLHIDGHVYFSDQGIINRVPYYFLAIGSITFLISTLGMFLIFLGSSDACAKAQATKPLVGECKQNNSIYQSSEATLFDLTLYEKHCVMDAKEKNNVQVAREDTSSEKQMSRSNLIESTDDKGNATKATSLSASVEMSPKEIIKTRQFWLLSLFTISLGHTFYIHANLYKAYGQRAISNDMALVAAGLLGVAGMVLTRPMVGLLTDRIGVLNTALAICSTSSVFMSLMVVTLHTYAWMYIIVSALDSTCVSLKLMMISLLTSTMFGRVHYASNLGLVCLGQLLFFLLEPLLITQVIHHLGWDWLFISGSLSAVLAMGLIMALDWFNHTGCGSDIEQCSST
ncbi:hypothetical protein PoB_007238800 [Plakobranchus ocellatus]|uniref:Major facilitator superfamily (MFS) profile domain-containing protein n=1 Tax=Plakobranchus ocellatus TaxID=259542 RepID=A0AAV4DNJ1_9GAST|nr:hypothetical protein PoB_007238800 [Plakobranchus ocellatus]